MLTHRAPLSVVMPRWRSSLLSIKPSRELLTSQIRLSKKSDSGADGDHISSKDGHDKPDSVSMMQKALSVLENSLATPSVESASHGRSQVLVLPVKQRPLFPGFYKAVMVKDRPVIEGIKSNLARNRPFVAAFMTKDEEYAGHLLKNPADIYRVGSLAQIVNLMPGPNGSLTVLLYPHQRVTIKTLVMPPSVALSQADSEHDSEVATDADVQLHSADLETQSQPTPEDGTGGQSTAETISLPFAFVEAVNEQPFDKESKAIHVLMSEIMDVMNEVVRLNPLVRDQMAEFVRSKNTLGGLFDDPVKIADFASAMSDAEPEHLQDIMECSVVEERLRKSLKLLKAEHVNAALQHEISQGLQSRIGSKEQESYLRERLSGIRKELGLETAVRDKQLVKFRSRAESLKMPDVVNKVFLEEMDRLAHLKPSSQEYNLTQNYLDWLTVVPWGKQTNETFGLDHAQAVLDVNHYGLKDVKERILEFIAVAQLRGTVEGKIICLVGPPGVGKTSIGKSIAKALARKFFRFSVGGLYDVAEIKGHRRTYVGAMPGKLVQALKSVESSNPLILIDEVDKIGHGGHSGDPSSALLEVLDPEQNKSFLDHYLDVPVDLSKVLFVCTANATETIPGPLLDRMELINLSGYLAEEKRMIAKNFLIPQAMQSSGVGVDSVSIDDRAIDSLIHHYCRESGVRHLKKKIEQIYRKSALKVVELSSSEHIQVSNRDLIVVDQSNLKDFVGSPLFQTERLFDSALPPGVVMGLAYSAMGGASLYIETVLESPLDAESKPSFTQTGKLGSVMKESANIAHSFAGSYLRERDPKNTFFEVAAVHLHVPEGATSKDGPSAGIAMCTALLSLAMNAPIDSDLAMTGELTLTGKVLKIGGVKEKVMAARRACVSRIILPIANHADFSDLPLEMRQGITPHFVSSYNEVFDLVFATKATI